MAGFAVQVDDEIAEKLTNRYSDERISQEIRETLETLAEEAPRKQDELRRNMNLPEERSDSEELSDDEFKERCEPSSRASERTTHAFKYTVC